MRPSPPPRASDEPDRRELQALERALTELALYDWLVVRSARAAEVVLSRVGGALPPRLRVAVQGTGARAVLARFGIEPALEVSGGSAHELVAALAPFLGRCERLLVPREGNGDAALLRGLESAGGEPVAVGAPGAGERRRDEAS